MKIEWNKVTWYSKIVALILFVGLPFIGFYYGMQYGRILQLIADTATSTAQVAAGYGAEYYQNIAEWQTDANNTRGGFSIAYPIDFDAQDNYSAVPVDDWRAGVPGGPGLKLFTLTIPKAFEPQTNFSDAVLSVGMSGNDKAVAQCMVPEMTDGRGSTSTVVVNGITFTVFRFTDVGAGNYYETTSYRTLHAGKCYAVEYTAHSAQIMNYPQEYHLHPYDSAKVTELMDRIVGTFKFL